MNENIAISIISGIVAIIVAIITSQSAAKKTAKETASNASIDLERRLTILEVNQKHIMKNMFSNEDRKCLKEVEVSLNWVITTMLGDAVKGLKNPAVLDALFTEIETALDKEQDYKAAFPILDDLSPEEVKQLDIYLKRIIKSEKSAIKKQRARIVLALAHLQERLKEEGLYEKTACAVN